MSATSLENKTIRPGRLIGYSYYYSNRRPLPPVKPARQASRRVQVRIPSVWRWSLVGVAVLAVVVFGPLLRGGNPAASTSSTSSNSSAPSMLPPGSQSKSASTAPVAATANHCARNKLDQFVVVSISQRHLWACQGRRALYNTPVVTGIDYLEADKTPTGTYKIYDKQTNVTLAGSDTTGSWSDPVHYWMPFLHNQYGSYGFHDATWRDNSAFGNISPNSADASHGCVELPLGASEWLYTWAQVGATVTIES